jgi:hypothetical protein
LLLLLGLASAVPLWSEFHETQYYILLSQFLRLPQLGGPYLFIFISPRNRVVQLYPRALGSLFVVSLDSKSSGGEFYFPSTCRNSPSLRFSCLSFFIANQLLSINASSILLMLVEVEVNLRWTVSRPVCIGIGLPSGYHDHIFYFCLTVACFLMYGALSDERMDL